MTQICSYLAAELFALKYVQRGKRLVVRSNAANEVFRPARCPPGHIDAGVLGDRTFAQQSPVRYI